MRRRRPDTAAAETAGAERFVPRFWLSRGAEWLVEQVTAGGVQAPIDVLIVGSGYGASVAAARFSAMAGRDDQGRPRPLRVVVLERGDEFVPGAFPDRFSQALPHLRADRWPDAAAPTVDDARSGLDQALFDFKIGPEVSALVGNGLGGGSLINAGVVERPSSDVFDEAHWPKALHHGLGTAGSDLDQAFLRAEAVLGASAFAGMPAKTAALFDDTRALAAEVGAGSMHAVQPKIAVTQHSGLNAQGVEQRACVACGNCVSGCNYWAKNTLPMNYLALARRQGAELYTGATVTDVRPQTHAAAAAWIVGFHLTHDRGERSRLAARIELRADHVVLAAGTYGTAAILHQSAVAHPAVFGHLVDADHGQLGRHFSCNGDGIAAAFDQAGRAAPVNGVGADPKVNLQHPGSVGPTITGMLDLRGRAKRNDRFVIQDAAIPFALRRLYEETLTTLGMVHGMTRWNERAPGARDPLAIDAERVGRTQFFLLVGHDEAAWRLRFKSTLTQVGSGADAPHLSCVSVDALDVAAKKRVRARQNEVDRLVALLVEGKTGGTYLPNPLWRPAPMELVNALKPDQPGSDSTADPLAAERLLTVHPLGGCRMADDAKDGVVNDRGQVFFSARGQEVFVNLVVMDGSVVPGSLGINPLLTIAALAERASLALMQPWSFNPGNAPLVPLPVQPAAVQPMFWAPDPTRLDFTEVMQGGLQLFVNKHVDLARLDKWDRAEALDARGRLRVGALFDDLASFCRDPDHRVAGSGGLKLFWKGQRASGTPNLELRPVSEIALRTIDIKLLHLLNSHRDERIWRALNHWWRTRGKAELREAVGNETLRRIAAAFLVLILGFPAGFLRRWTVALLESSLVQALGKISESVLGLVRIASHHGEARAMTYDLGTLAAADTPFRGEVRVLAAKRIHYGMASGYGSRPSKGIVRRSIPARVPSNPWRAVIELGVLMVSTTEGRRLTGADWPRDQRPAWLTARHRVVAKGKWGLDLEALIGASVPQLQSFQSLPDAWLDMVSFTAFMARCLGQTYFWSWRLPAYPAVVKPDDLGPLPGFRYDENLEKYVEQPGRGTTWQQHRLAVGSGRQGAVVGDEPTEEVVLTRFMPAAEAPARKHPVVLMHGFVTSGYQFATPRLKTNAVQWLTARGFDVWVLDLRTSVAVAGSHKDWNFDIVARADVPAAFNLVRAVTNTKQVHVVAHCMGSAAFNMAVLGGHLEDGDGSYVRSSVQTSVSMDVVSTPPNRLKAAAIRIAEDLFDAKELSVVADRHLLEAANIAETLLDRFLMTWPKNDRDAELQADNDLLRPRQNYVATVNRINAFYGRNFSHENLSAAMLQHLHEVFRHASVETFRHVLQLHRAGHVVDRDGMDVYLTDKRVQEHYGFPSRLIHGQFGAVFGQASTRRSHMRLQRLQPDVRNERFVLTAPRDKDGLLVHPNWGHFDLWLSERAAAEVFPPISEFLESEDAPAGAPAVPPKPSIYRYEAPEIGPRLGWWRKDTASAPGAGLARLWFRSPFRDGDAEVRVFAAETPVVKGAPIVALTDWQTVALRLGCGIVDVSVPPSAKPRALALVCRSSQATFFRDPDPSSRADANGQLWDFDPLIALGEVHVLGEVRAKPAARSRNSLGMGSGTLYGGKLHHPVPAAFLKHIEATALFTDPGSPRNETNAVREMIETRPIDVLPSLFRQLDLSSELDFLLASCRYQATDMEADAANLSLVSTPADRFDFALLVGDQIYADASYGVLDGRPSQTRLRDKYASFWAGSAGALGRRMPVYLCGDDHEVRDDWFVGMRATDDQRKNDAAGLDALDAYQVIATPGWSPGAATLQRYYAFASAGFQFGVLDARFERGAPGSSIWSTDQRAWFAGWLRSAVAASNGRPIFIATSVSLFPFDRDFGTAEDAARGDGWQSYPQSARELFDTLFAANCTRVVFLAGDLHLSHYALGAIVHPDGRRIEVESIVSSGLNAPIPFANKNPADIVAPFDGKFPAGSGYRVAYDVVTATAVDGWAGVRVWQDGAGGWRVDVRFR